MAERHRSKDGSRDTEEILGDSTEVETHGSAGGNLARKIGTRDHEKRAMARPAGATRVTKADEIDGGTDRGDE